MVEFLRKVLESLGKNQIGNFMLNRRTLPIFQSYSLGVTLSFNLLHISKHPLTLNFSIFLFDLAENITGFLMFSKGSKGNIVKKRVKANLVLKGLT